MNRTAGSLRLTAVAAIAALRLSMLDPTQPLSLPAIRTAVVYRDHADTGAFHLVPVAPSIARDERGLPSIRITFISRRVGGHREVQSAQLTIETRLSVPDHDRAAIAAAIDAMRQPPASSTPDVRHTLPPVRLSAPEWTAGEVEVVFGESLSVIGQPSLFADNTCALHRGFDHTTATTLETLWNSSLPDGRIIYRMTLRAASMAHEKATASSERRASDAYSSTSVTGTMRVDFKAVEGIGLQGVFESPLWSSELATLARNLDL
ncbi:MAG: hypothetical protein AB7F99_17930 [Vicinamibacterales bacterium]